MPRSINRPYCVLLMLCSVSNQSELGWCPHADTLLKVSNISWSIIGSSCELYLIHTEDPALGSVNLIYCAIKQGPLRF